jgi:hypothetical protein
VVLIWLDSVLMDRRVKQLSKSHHSFHTLHMPSLRRSAAND